MKKELPILALRDLDIVVFPGGVYEIDVGRSFSIRAIEASQNNYAGKLLIGFQNDSSVSEPTADHFYTTCVEADIKKKIVVENGKIRLIVGGVKRCKIESVGRTAGDEWYLYGEYQDIVEGEPEITKSLLDKLTDLIEVITLSLPSVAIEKEYKIESAQDLSAFVDRIASQLPVSGKDKLNLLRKKDPKERLETMVILVQRYLQSQGIDVKNDCDCLNNQAQQQQDPMVEELKKIKKQIDKANMPPEAKKVADQEFRRLTMMPSSSSEFQVCLNYVELLANLPWDISTEDKIDIDLARKILDEDHYGLEKVKERILEFLAVRKLAPDRKGSILCLSGAPGVGKTSIAKSIARAMDRKFIRMSLGGISDEAEIRGHRRTYVGAMPGKIIQNLKRCGCNNPVFNLDEVDKIHSNMRGDPASALLEVLDPEQNNTFVDNYMNVPFDLSKILFIATANEIGTIPPALRDRLEIIELPGYSPQEKIRIAKKYLIPKQKQEYGLKDMTTEMSDDAILSVIDEYTCEAGVRSLERNCGTVFRKLAVKVASNSKVKDVVEKTDIPEFLGPPKMFAEKKLEGNPEVGLSTGLAWSSYGGSILFIEASFVPGKGEIKLTGNLGDVIKESAAVAFAWIKSNGEKLNVNFEKLSKNDIQLHFPAGAVPKDGPSAGIAITSAILSLLTDRPVRNDVAMTGEISLKGRVLPVGGVREKVLAAHRAGIRTVIHPVQNTHDVDDLPKDIKDEMEFIPATKLIDIIEKILLNGLSGDCGTIGTGEKKNLANLEA